LSGLNLSVLCHKFTDYRSQCLRHHSNLPSSIGVTAHCGLCPVEQYPSIFSQPITNSLHLTPITWKSLSTSSLHSFQDLPLRLTPPVLETSCYQLQNIIWGSFNPLNAELNPICHLLALLGVHYFLHVSRIRVNACHQLLLNRHKCHENLRAINSILSRVKFCIYSN